MGTEATMRVEEGEIELETHEKRRSRFTAAAVFPSASSQSPSLLTFVLHVCITVCIAVGLAKRFVVLYLKMQVVEKLAGVDD